MAYQDALLDSLDPQARRRQMTVPGLQPGGTATGPDVSTQGGPANDPRWTDGTWGGTPGGIAAPWTPGQPAPQGPGMPTPASPQAGRSAQQIFMDEAAKQQYGQGGYAALDQALTPQGFQFQKNSAGQYRGRVKAPGGDIWDTALNEGNDGAFLGGGAGTTGAFGVLNRGQEGLDAGGWSFGGGSSGGGLDLSSLMTQPNTGGQTPLGPSGDGGQQAIANGVAQYSEPSQYLKALLEQLGQGT